VTDTDSRATPSRGEKPAETQLGKINAKLIDKVSVTLEAFLGESRMTVADLTNLKEDAVVTLDAALNQAVELRLNGVAVARGELVAVGDKFAVRLVEISK
jgi:flagellar motor switch protein FliN